MRALAVALLASLSLCAQPDAPRRSGGEPARSPQADTSRRAGGGAAALPRGGTFQRAPGLSADSFAAGLGPRPSELTHPVVETDAWKLGGKALIAYYRYDVDAPGVEEPVFQAAGYAFLPVSPGRYRRVLIGEIGHNGGEPQVRSVFFANADPDPEPELIVIAAWHVMNPLVGGTVYETYVHDRPSTPGADSFVYLEDVSRRVSGGCECEWTEEKRSRRARFKTAADVRAGLRELGYR
jgi:hypothetical protein